MTHKNSKWFTNRTIYRYKTWIDCEKAKIYNSKLLNKPVYTINKTKILVRIISDPLVIVWNWVVLYAQYDCRPNKFWRIVFWNFT